MRKRLLGVLVTGAVIVSACGGTTPTTAPQTTAPESQAPVESTEPTESAAPAEQSMTMVMDGDVSGGLSNAADNVPTAEAAQFLYDGIYVYDATLTPVPNLAAELAEVTEEGKVWTIKLKEGVKFHDGSDLTADDVLQTYQIAQSDNCRYNPSICLASVLETVEAVDDYTVKFTLISPNATWPTVYMPAILIENKDVIDASYDRYLGEVQAVTQEQVQAAVDKFAAETETPTGPAGDDGAPTPNYEQFQAEFEALLTSAGQELPDKTIYTTDGVLDVSTYVTELNTRLQAVLATFGDARIDALAAAYPYLDVQTSPVGMGSGPFKFVEFKSGESITYEAFADYHRGAPQIAKFNIPIIKDDIAGAQALAAGQVDWKYSLTGPAYLQIKDNPDLQFIEYPDFGFFSLYFNLHPDTGSPWLDPKVRQATNYCFDKIATTEAATEGQGVAIYSEIPPASWAFPSEGLETYPFDVAKGQALLEEAGWTLGADGIREKDGVKLSTVTPVRAERPDRSKWMQLMGDQVRTNCGIDVQFKEVDFAALLNMLDVYPHVNAADSAGGTPFYLYFGGFSTSLDPDPFSLYHSKECSTAERPSTFNYICYSNPEVDALIDQGLATFDQAERAAIYQQYAVLQSQDLPVIYAWADIAREGLRATVGSTAGPLVMDSPTWFWETEKLTNVK
jgi:ABC-type transport system substrate-binding protein